MHYALLPYVWLLTPFPHWSLPQGTAIDLRPLPAQALQGEAPQGFALVVAPTSFGIDELAEGDDLNAVRVNPAIAAAWRSAVGYQPTGATLAAALYETLTVGSDPSGLTAAKPLMPTMQGDLELHLRGLVRSEQFRWGVHPHTSRVRDLLQRDFEAAFTDENDPQPRRMLDFLCEKYGVDDWQEFVPVQLRAHVRGRLPHSTTITESFNKADSSTLGPDLTWTEIGGDLSVVSNQANNVSGGAVIDTGRADSDLSSSDHYSQSSIQNIADLSAFVGNIFRKDSSATMTYYHVDCTDFGATWRTFKVVANSFTSIGTNTNSGVVGGDIIKGQANGTTIKRFKNGSEIDSVTDSAISSGVRCGIALGFNVANNAQSDLFEAADLAGPTAPPNFGMQEPAQFGDGAMSRF